VQFGDTFTMGQREVDGGGVGGVVSQKCFLQSQRIDDLQIAQLLRKAVAGTVRLG